MKTIRFGVIGCGLMGREFGSAAARWCHLTGMDARPEIVAVCSRNPAPKTTGWFTDNFSSVRQVTNDYRELLANPEVNAVYCAVPHHLHQETYCATIEAGKHLMGEKPFGIDKPANEAILDCIEKHPDVFVRCASQFPFAPALQRIGALIDAGVLGTILEVESGFLHSSDLDTNKPINWKRQVKFNGEYGAMGDLGMHVCHMALRAGWMPRNVRAILSNIVQERPDGKGGMAPCETWDNATLLIETHDPQSGDVFPWTLKTQRIAPGEKNTWYFNVLGTKTSVRFSTRNINVFELLEYSGKEQSWRTVEAGHEVAYSSITGPVFEFGFSDAILQMWAAFIYEMINGEPPCRFAGCATPHEAAISHRLFTAALESQKQTQTVAV